MKNKRRLTAMLLAGCLAVSSVPVAFAEDAPEQQQEQVFTLADQAREDSKAAAPTEGTCGKNASWKLENGTLTISGTGKMTDYSSSNMPWYDSRSSITRVVVENGITSLGKYAFYYCRSLNSMTIPDSVTSIGECAFSYCSDLRRVTIPDSVTSIGDSVFDSCSSLTSVTIGSGVTNIGNQAFRYCSSLTSVAIGSSVTSIGDSAFFECSSLNRLTIPNSVMSIGDSAFFECSSLTNVTIGNGVTSIGNQAFRYCSSLTSITISNRVTKIGDRTFNGCSSLTSVTIGNSVTNIGEHAFESCSSLSRVIIPDSVTSVGNSAFRNCSSLTSVTIGNGITSIEFETFGGCKNLTSVTIGSGVTSIGEHAFRYCSSLINVTIPDSVVSIGDYAFYACSSLTNAIIGDSVISIGNSAFGYCSGLTSITMPNSVTSIGDYAFQSSGLSEIYFMGDAPSIDDSSFTGIFATAYYPRNTSGWEMVIQNQYGGMITWKPWIPGETLVTKIFSDIYPSAWYIDYVQFVYDNGLMTGTSKTTFEPETTLNRAMIAQVLYNYDKRVDSPYRATNGKTFKDVSKNDWFYEAIQWASANGIASGVGNGYFEPNSPVTREQVAQFLYNYNGRPSVSGNLPFSDADKVSGWAKNAMLWAYQNKIINGTTSPDGGLLLDPQGGATRAQAAAILTNYMRNMM